MNNIKIVVEKLPTTNSLADLEAIIKEAPTMTNIKVEIDDQITNKTNQLRQEFSNIFVQKQIGKSLTSNDFTDAHKTVVEGIDDKLTAYALKTDLPEDYISEETLSTYALKTDLPNLDDFVRTTALAITLNNYAHKTDIPTDYLTAEDLQSYAHKSDIPDNYLVDSDLNPVRDSIDDLSTRVKAVEERPSGGNEYDDTEIKARLTALESRTDSDTIYDDSAILARLTALEAKTDKDTIYDDTALANRVSSLEAIDHTKYLTSTGITFAYDAATETLNITTV